MIGVDMLAEAVREIRWEAATEYARAVDQLTTLEACERATGRRFVTAADRARVIRRRERWERSRNVGIGSVVRRPVRRPVLR